MKINNPISSDSYKQFADNHSLVFFDQFNDESHPVVRGVTLSHKRHDSKYAIGNIDGFDITFLERTVGYQKPKSSKRQYTWAIMHLTTDNIVGLPHVFLDGSNRYHEDVYESIFTKFSKMILAPNPYESPFFSNYRVFTNPETAVSIGQLLPEELTSNLSKLGHTMDYEMIENQIYIYLPGGAKDTNELEKMFSALKIITLWQESD